MKTVKTLSLLIAALFILTSAVSCKANDRNTLISTMSDNGCDFELYGNNGVVNAVKVTKSGKSVCVLQTHGKSPEFFDVNFDGNRDLRLSSLSTPGSYQCFIYQPSAGTYTPEPLFQELLDPVWDAEKQEISCRVHRIIKYSDDESDAESGYKEMRGAAVWIWSGGILTQISETGIEHDSDSELYCSYRCVFTAGELVRENASDKWYYAAELEGAGLEW